MPGNERDDFNNADTAINPVNIGDAAVVGEPVTGKPSSALSRSIVVAASIILFFVALGVIFVLPRHVDQNLSPTARSTEIQTPAIVENPPNTSLPKSANREISVESRRASQELFEQVLQIVTSLEQRNVKQWAKDKFAAAQEKIADGEKAYREQRYSTALEIYQNAYNELRSIDESAAQVIESAVADGFKHIDDGNSHGAQKSFEFALAIAPDHDEAAKGLRRSKTLDRVLALASEAKGYEEIGELAAALTRYEEVYALDNETPGVAQSIARVKQIQLANEYRKLMSQGISAFDKGNNTAARKSFIDALKVKPQAVEAADALAQVESKILAQKITEHLREALKFEQSENWPKAGAQYRSAAKLDPELDGAKSGALRADKRAKLDRQLNSYIAQPARLADDNVHREAQAILARAESVANKGTRLANQIARLAKTITVARTPIPITLLSDEMTDVTLYKIGPLGQFKQHSMSIIPGHYVVVGRRDGFRDVRVEFDLSPDRAGVAITVQCERRLAFGDRDK